MALHYRKGFMMKVIYSVAVEPGTNDIDHGVVVPDLPGCFSSGDTHEQALQNIKDAIEMHLEALALDNQLPPARKCIDEHMQNHEYFGFVWSMVEIDLAPYMGESSKINVTLPNLLTKQIDDFVKSNEAYKNRSQFLQEAARAQIAATQNQN